MANEMSWKECVQTGIITQPGSDQERSNQMLMMANLRLKFWDKKVTDEFIVLKIEAYYDIIKELIFAHLYWNGYNCTTISASLPISRKGLKISTLKFRK